MPESSAAAGTGHGDLDGSLPSVAVPTAGTAVGRIASTDATALGPDGAALTSLQVLRGPRGLLETQAEERLGRLGDNTLPAWRPVSWPQRFVRSLRDPFTSVLLCLGLVSAAVSAWGTASVTLVLVVVSCLLRVPEGSPPTPSSPRERWRRCSNGARWTTASVTGWAPWPHARRRTVCGCSPWP